MPDLVNPRRHTTDARSRSLALGLLAGGLLLTAGSVALAVAEVAPFVALSTTPAGQFLALSSPGLALPLSEASRVELLESCDALERTVFARAQPSGKRTRLLEQCQRYALATVNAAPSVAIGWAVAADLAAELQDKDRFNRYLRASQLAAPNEQWIAEFRVLLVEDNYAIAGEAVKAGELADLGLLVVSRRGIASIAKRYVDQADFRERVTNVVERLPEEDQRRFVDEVRKAAGASSQ